MRLDETWNSDHFPLLYQNRATNECPRLQRAIRVYALQHSAAMYWSIYM